MPLSASAPPRQLPRAALCFDSPEAFERAIEAEMAKMAYHDTQGREPTIKPRKKQAEPKPKVEGAPGSIERWAWAAKWSATRASPRRRSRRRSTTG
jgi:hypothetical protein